MARSALTLLLFLLQVSTLAAQQAASRVDPHLRWSAFVAARAPVPVTPAGLSALRAGGEVALLVRLAPGGLDALQAAGARVGAVAGDVASVRVPASALPTLAGDARLAYLEAAAWLPFPTPSPALRGQAVPLRDGAQGVAAAGGDRTRARVGEAWEGATGEGVLVGVFDTGLDLAHEDFRRPDGTTRVAYAWDQEGSGPPITAGSHVFDYGVECTAAAIDAGACPLRDNVGHGTHVTGIAVGDGSATGNGAPAFRFPGMAPGAELLVVRGGDTGADAAALLDGVAWMVARAEALGRPLVVNLSIATQSGPHDGTTLLERGLDALAGPGRLLVTVAGNQGNNRNEQPPFVRQSIHATGQAAAGAPVEHAIVVPAYAPTAGSFTDGAVLELWYAGADALSVEVVSPGGHALLVAPGDSAVALTPDGGIFIDNAAAGPQAINGDRVALLTLFDMDAAAPPAAGRWTVRVRRLAGQDVHHLWLVGSSLATATALTSLEGGVTNTHLVGSPGGARNVLTVGAFTHRHGWWGPGGEPAGYPFQEALGDLAHFSSPGPLRATAALPAQPLKPELTAPGKLAISARGRDARLWNDLPLLTEADGVHAALLGTSMAAPYVTGAAALLLQHAPGLDPAGLVDMLTGTARTDAFTSLTYSLLPGGHPNVHWGWGKLDARAALRSKEAMPGTVTVTALAGPGGTFTGTSGGAVTLLTVTVTAGTAEPVDVGALALQVTAPGLSGRLVSVVDADGDGVIGAADPVVGEVPLPASGSVSLPGPVVPAGRTLTAHVRVELDEPAPNGARVEASLDDMDVEGVLSGAMLSAATPAVTGAATAVLLGAETAWALSENPVRGEVLVVSFRERPSRAAVYTVAGGLVQRLEVVHSAGGGRAEWDLRDGDGRPVATGVYLLLVELPGGALTEKVFVVRGR